MYFNRLSFLEDRNGLKQKNAALFLNISEGMYSKYKREIQIFPIKKLVALCDYYDISLDYILELTDIKIYPNLTKSFDVDLMTTRLKEIRKKLNLNQEQISDILSVSKSTYAEYECGTYVISTYTLYSLCKNYNVSADYLLGRIDNPKFVNC